MATPATLAGVSDLADWLGEPIAEGTDDAKRAALCLRLASALVRKESGQTWLNDDGSLKTVPEEAFTVTLYCASRVYDNRNAQTSGGLDDYSEGWKVDESGAYLTATERRSLASLRSSNTFGGLGTVSTTRGETYVDSTGWVPTPTHGVFFPWY